MKIFDENLNFIKICPFCKINLPKFTTNFNYVSSCSNCNYEVTFEGWQTNKIKFISFVLDTDIHCNYWNSKNRIRILDKIIGLHFLIQNIDLKLIDFDKCIKIIRKYINLQIFS